MPVSGQGRGQIAGGEEMMKNSVAMNEGTAVQDLATAANSALVSALNERTSSRIAAIAERGVDDPASLKLEEIRSLCASVLAHASDS